MILSEQKFYEETLDLTIPALRLAADAYAAGDRTEAAHRFAGYVKQMLRQDLYFSLKDYGRENVWARSDETDREVCERILRGQFMSVGVPIDFGSIDGVDWYANPTYNNYGEWGWQFHRSHEWKCLGKVYRDTGDERYARGFAGLIRSWITSAEPCPGDKGQRGSLHWRTIECGIRMTSNWHYAIHAFLDSPAIDDELWVLIFMSVWEHAYMLRRFNTSNNWLIMELNGLLHIGVLYRFFREAEEWIRYSLDRLTSELIRQVYPDSFQVELTTGYHSGVIGNYAQALHFCTIYGTELPESLMERYHRMFYMPILLQTPAGVTPSLNDGGPASAMRTARNGLHFFPDDEILQYFATQGAKGRLPDYTTAVLPYSGMVAFRSSWSADAMYGFFESAPFGAAHQHEDKLNFVLYAYGTDMLTDPGNFRYDNSLMRQYVLGTRSHNTGLVDHLPQNRRAGYRWDCQEVHKKSDLSVRLGEQYEVAEGVYNEGYGAEHLDAVHRRKVIFCKHGLVGLKPFFLLIDHYTCDDTVHTYETSFQLPTVPVEMRGKNILARYDTGASLLFVSSSAPAVYTARTSPEYMGWRPDQTPECTEHFPAPLISYEEHDVCAHIVTLLYPIPAGECAPDIAVTADSEGFTVILPDKETVYFRYDCEEFRVDAVREDPVLK